MSSLAPDHLVVFGRPGSGKSSLAERLAADHGYVLVRTGEMLREAVRRGDALGKRVEADLARGLLVADSVIADLLLAHLGAPDEHKLLFDGFPRTIEQVPILDRLERRLKFRIGCYLEIALDRSVAESRMTGRRVCPTCGATYHIRSQPPKTEEVCDRDGTKLERRKDDRPDVVALRQEVYQRQTDPILGYYRTHTPGRVRVVNGDQPFEAVYAEILQVLSGGPLTGR